MTTIIYPHCGGLTPADGILFWAFFIPFVIIVWSGALLLLAWVILYILERVSKIINDNYEVPK